MYTNRTKELFAGLIERPPLTDQLLQRPPFRFLHDIVKMTMQNTGFLMDNFTNEEMDASNITDKTAKANFLKTLIKALNSDGSLKDVKAAKIIAGKEPEMTNLMLQKLAIDAAAFRDSKFKCTANEEKQKREKKAHKKERNNKGVERKNNDNENEKILNVEKEKRHSSRSKEKRKKEGESKPKIIKQTVDCNEGRDSVNEGHLGNITPETSSMKMEQVIHTDQESYVTTKVEGNGIVNNITNEIDQPSISQALKEQLRLSTSSGRPRTSAGRLGTAAARPAPPKIKKKRVKEIERKADINAKTSGVIVGERQENDEYFVTEIEPSHDETDQINADELITEEHGGLVRKILETKKGLEDKISKEAYNASISVFDEKDQARSQQELANLQKTIQQITQTTHLLARFLDNTQEDAESMFKEMEEWRLESAKNLHNLQERKANAEGSSENLLLKLNQLDEQIKEVKSAIVQTKAKVITNEEKIRILVNNI
ncbi:Microtubule-binding protein MIP-T3 family protein [Acanthocheilonema viteae]